MDDEKITTMPLGQERMAPPVSVWRIFLPLTLIAMALIILVYWSTLASMVDIWIRSETFTHGFIIFPISGYLIWRQRRLLAKVMPHTDLWALLPLGLLVFIWLLARIAGVLVVEQLAFVAMLPSAAWLLLGRRVLRPILFPLIFLFFAVPMGEVLIEPMMHMTALFVIEAVRMTGIPVYATGTFFSLPSGHWSVVEGCSGVRYLIASITLGVLYAYLTYQSYLKRALFILFSILFPIVANWLRAFIIVMLGHFSDMKLATGVDHLIYGWVFFGFVILLLFWLGGFWRDPLPDESEPPVRISIADNQRSNAAFRLLPLVLAGVIVLSGPLWAQQLLRQSDAQRVYALELSTSGAWIPESPSSINWKPSYLNPTLDLQQLYVEGDAVVGVYLAFYAEQRQDAELINSQNVMIPQKHPVWSQLAQANKEIAGKEGDMRIKETHLSSFNQDLLIWHWHELGGYRVHNPYYGKMIEALLTLIGRHPEGVAYVVYTPLDRNSDIKLDKARQRLQAFVDTMIPVFRLDVEHQLQ